MNRNRTFRQALDRADTVVLKSRYKLGGTTFLREEIITKKEATRLASGAMANVLDEEGELNYGLHGTGWCLDRSESTGLLVLSLG